MAVVKYYAVYDKKAEAFMQPFACRTDGEAMRTFMDAVQDEKSPFHKYPGDFDLYVVADWNDSIGSFVPTNGGAKSIITGIQVSQSGE